MDCYDEILYMYNHSKCLNISLEQWMNSYIIKLMNETSISHDNLRIQNSLILLLNLFCAKVPDRYHGLGKSISELTKEEIEQLYRLLIIEITT